MLNELFKEASYFGFFLTLFTYYIGYIINKKFKSPIFNPLLISTIIIIAVLCLFRIDYETYNYGAQHITYFLTPATVCYAVPLHQEMKKLKENTFAIMVGIITGVLTSMLCVLALALIFKLTHEQYVTLLPKSITTAFGYGVSDELSGIPSITVPVIIITGVVGNVFGQSICRIAGIRNRIAVGLAFGSSSHALGTAKALELGELEGAMSSISVVVSGIITVIIASVFAGFY